MRYCQVTRQAARCRGGKAEGGAGEVGTGVGSGEDLSKGREAEERRQRGEEGWGVSLERGFDRVEMKVCLVTEGVLHADATED